MMAARRTPNYASRGVYVDYLRRFAWSRDSHGRKTYRTISVPEEVDAVQDELQRELDASDPIPRDAFVPAPLSRPRHLKLL